MATVYGYARCSTDETQQDVNRQRRELISGGVKDENIFMEYEHGTTEHKQQQELLFKAMAAGDTLMVTEVSRLSRSTKQLCQITDLIQEKKLRLVILNSVTIDCRNGEPDPMSKAFLQMAGVFSELEREMIRSRVKSGMANAAAKGKKIGRPELTKDNLPNEFYKGYSLWVNGQISKTEFARMINVSRPTLDKYISVS